MTFLSGQKVTAAALNAAVGAVEIPYTPTLTSWTLGNGTVEGYYRQMVGRIRVRIVLTVGSTTGKAGVLKLSLPSGFSGITDRQPVDAVFRDDSTGAVYAGLGYLDGSASAIQPKTTDASGNTNVTSTTPFTWATGDTIELLGELEIA